MLKFPPIPGRNKKMSYSNGCISEYIACHIYELLGIEVQDTLLGTYTDKRGKEKIVVACRDFTAGGKKLIEFAQLKNTCIDKCIFVFPTSAIEEDGIAIGGKLLREIYEVVNHKKAYRYVKECI